MLLWYNTTWDVMYIAYYKEDVVRVQFCSVQDGTWLESAYSWTTSMEGLRAMISRTPSAFLLLHDDLLP